VEDDGAVDCIFIDVNDAFTEITGLGREILGKRGSEVYGNLSDDFAKRMEIYRKLLPAGSQLNLSFTLSKPKNGCRYQPTV